ncbi:YcgN family cysteine cluster protein [Caenispirillum salinarum]|uniref:YcgN family cysteine cluster protein n=1 Tax=Caenispirillum salinarum TaxID=859058 RepID=UPI00384EA275
MSAPSSASTTRPFWETKRLEDMTVAEWESLCDGCGKCCLHKLQEEDDEDGTLGPVEHTNVACRLLDVGTCRCSRYETRFRYVPDCVQLTPEDVRGLNWLPGTCAYRLVAEGQPLPWWHPLVSGDPETVHEAGVSVRGRVISETRAGPLQHHIVEWPDL